MFRNRLLKILALLMVLNILIIPLTTFTPQQQNKYKVYAAEGVVDIRFYNAVISMIGITAAGLAAMSPSFSIPEVDLVQMKNNFAQSLEADAVKKQAWLAAQTDYLAGGISKTMGAIELAKIGVNDIYLQFKTYLHTKFSTNTTETVPAIDLNYSLYSFVKTFNGINMYQTQADPKYFTAYMAGKDLGMLRTYFNGSDYRSPIHKEVGQVDNTYINSHSLVTDKGISYYKFFDSMTGNLIGIWAFKYDLGVFHYVELSNTNITTLENRYNIAKIMGIDLALLNINTSEFGNGYINYNNQSDVINTTQDSISLIPTIPWLDPAIPAGTIVTPAIAAPYAGTIPIDVPMTVPIDPPIDEPVDPPVEENIAGTIAAILAGLTPIAGFLEYILAGQVSLTDTIEAGITGLIDGIGDIAGTLTGGITSSLTDIQSSISTLFDPPTETLNLEKLKNLNSVLFTKFPFSIPFDFVSMISAFSSDPVAPVITIPFDMSDFGGQFTEVKMDLSDYNNIAAVARQIGFIGFVFFMLFNTRKLIWK